MLARRVDDGSGKRGCSHARTSKTVKQNANRLFRGWIWFSYSQRGPTESAVFMIRTPRCHIYIRTTPVHGLCKHLYRVSCVASHFFLYASVQISVYAGAFAGIAQEEGHTGCLSRIENGFAIPFPSPRRRSSRTLFTNEISILVL